MTDLRQAAQSVVERWDTPAWEWRDQGPTADLMADLRTALAQSEQEPSQWRDMVVVSLVREGINKHRARELADHFATPLAAQRKPLTFDAFLESQDFYDLMQTYRHFPTDALKPFEAVKEALRSAHNIKEQL